jgi:hypothetical protein
MPAGGPDTSYPGHPDAASLPGSIQQIRRDKINSIFLGTVRNKPSKLVSGRQLKAFLHLAKGENPDVAKLHNENDTGPRLSPG